LLLSGVTRRGDQQVRYRLAIDGDGLEKTAWSLFLQVEFPSYERFWLKHVVPLTTRPVGIHFKDDPALEASGKTHEDLAIAQLHYTVLKHLMAAHQASQAQPADEFTVFVGLSSLCGGQDVAFELLQRYTNRGKYAPWAESSRKCPPGLSSGQAARRDWQEANRYPLQDIREYRNMLIHGRARPWLVDAGGMRLPAIVAVDKYCDWRTVTDPSKATAIPPSDFQYAHIILQQAWSDTVKYLEAMWQTHLK
jgi:hypothetical protein